MNHFDDDECDEDEEEGRKHVHVHFGPYFRCKSLPKIGTKNIATCENPACELRESDRHREEHVYCYKCGSKLVRKDVPDDRLRRCSFELGKQVGREIRPSFSHWRSDCDIWVPSRGGSLPKAPREFSLLNPPEIVVIEDENQVQEEKDWFLYTLAPIAYRNLCEVYGAENVALEWGVLTWES